MFLCRGRGICRVMVTRLCNEHIAMFYNLALETARSVEQVFCYIHGYPSGCQVLYIRRVLGLYEIHPKGDNEIELSLG